MNTITKISDITVDILADYVRTSSDDELLQICFEGAKGYILSETGLTLEEADEHADLAIACLVLTADMYDNRSTSTTSANSNRVVEATLYHHRKNLV